MFPRISPLVATLVLVAMCVITFIATHVPMPHRLMSTSSHWIPHLDKYVHATIYAALAIVTLVALRSWGFRWCWQLAAAVFLWLIVWGMFDELTQSLVAGRSTDPADLAADAVGASLGIGIIAILRKMGNAQLLAASSDNRS